MKIAVEMSDDVRAARVEIQRLQSQLAVVRDALEFIASRDPKPNDWGSGLDARTVAREALRELGA